MTSKNSPVGTTSASKRRGGPDVEIQRRAQETNARDAAEDFLKLPLGRGTSTSVAENPAGAADSTRDPIAATADRLIQQGLSIYYQDEAVLILNSDCREILPTLGHVDHVITDPPYEAEAHTLQRRTNRSSTRCEPSILTVEPLEFAPITGARDEMALAISRLPLRWVLTFCQAEASQEWRRSYEAGGLVYRRTCIWVKPDGMPQYSGDRPGMGYESFVAMHAPGRSRWNGGGHHGVYTYSKGENGILGNEHPTQKPLNLMVKLVEDFTDPDETILDPFAGSGTTGRAAKDLGRRAILIEREEKYCEIAAKRMAQGVLFGVSP